MMSSKPSVLIVGITGMLGYKIASAILDTEVLFSPFLKLFDHSKI